MNAQARKIRHRIRRRLRRIRDLVTLDKADRRRLKRLRRRAPTVMFDDVDTSQIPADAPAVGGYVGGSWPTFQKLAALFPRARRFSFAVASKYDADCLDIESGDATPADGPAWVKRQKARGVKRPAVYASVSQMDDVLAHLHNAGIKRAHVRVFTAHYSFRSHRCDSSCELGTTADATQWTDRALGRSLDESLLADDFWD